MNPGRRELRQAAVLAAREARGLLVQAIRVLEAPANDGIEAEAQQLARELTVAIGALFGCELGGVDVCLERMLEASAVVSGVLSRVHGPALGTRVDEAGALVARGLAVVYPVRAGLERELHTPRLGESRTEGAEEALFRGADTQLPPLRAPRVELGADSARAPSPRSEPPLESPDGRLRRSMVELVRSPAGQLVDRASGASEMPASPHVAERRTRNRVSLEVDIGLQSETQFYAGLSNDISEGGLFVSTVKPLPLGTDLTVSFVLPGGHAVTTTGRVAWLAAPRDEHSRPGMGVRFVELDPLDRAAIERFLRVRPAMFHEV